MMRSAVHEGRPHEILAPEQKAGALRPAHRLPTAVGNQVGSSRQVRIRSAGKFRGSIDDDGHTRLVSRRDDRLQPHRSSSFAGSEHGHHRRARSERGVKRLHAIDVDHPRAPAPKRVVVHVAGFPGHDHFVPESCQIGQLLHQLRIGARNARGRRLAQGSRGTRRHNRALAADELGNPRPDLFHQLVDVDRVVGGLVTSLTHFGKLQRAAVDGERAGQVDERTDADPRVDLRSLRGRGKL